MSALLCVLCVCTYLYVCVPVVVGWCADGCACVHLVVCVYVCARARARSCAARHCARSVRYAGEVPYSQAEAERAAGMASK